MCLVENLVLRLKAGDFFCLRLVFRWVILRNKLDDIKDAMEPGGSGDPYAGLNPEEAAALREAKLLGFPMKTWCVYDTLGEGALPFLMPISLMIDLAYCKDFWEQPGYLGSLSIGERYLFGGAFSVGGLNCNRRSLYGGWL